MVCVCVCVKNKHLYICVRVNQAETNLYQMTSPQLMLKLLQNMRRWKKAVEWTVRQPEEGAIFSSVVHFMPVILLKCFKRKKIQQLQLIALYSYTLRESTNLIKYYNFSKRFKKVQTFCSFFKNCRS